MSTGPPKVKLSGGLSTALMNMLYTVVGGGGERLREFGGERRFKFLNGIVP